MRHAIVLTIASVLLLTAVLAGTYALLSWLPVWSHHVAVAAASTDAEAFALTQSEYQAQHDAVLASFNLWAAARSSDESSTALNDLEGVIETTIVHLEGLDVRPCFEVWHRAALLQFTTLAADMALIRAGEQSSFVDAGWYYALVHDPRFTALMECE